MKSEWILFAGALLAAVSGIFSLTRQLQMLQQNSYFPSRYCKWVKESYTVELALEAILFCALSMYRRGGTFLPQAILLAALLVYRIVSAFRTQKKSIKKLVPTARVKRLYGAAILVLVMPLAVFALLPETLGGEICIRLVMMLAAVTPLLALTAWALTAPIERAVSRWYINDAKRILREHSGLTVIGVTGSYGKTTTKFILERILSEKFNVVATPQSFNTPMGVVRTVRNDLKPQTQIFICEMGAKKTGDIKEICEIAHPTCGIITSVGPQHLDTFRSLDNVFSTKFELADEIRKNRGAVFVNGSSEEILSRKERLTDCRLFGFSPDFDCYAEDITYGKNGSSFDLVLDGERVPVTTRLLGMHSVNDIVGAAALAHYLGVSSNEIRFAVAALKPTEHRLEMKTGPKHSLLIDDAYNANPVGCIEAVRVLGRFEGMRRVIITPGLIELGEKEYECNYALGLAAAEHCDDIIFVGRNRSKPMRDAVETTAFDASRVHVAASFAEAMQIYTSFCDQNSVVLLENDLPDNYLN